MRRSRSIRLHDGGRCISQAFNCRRLSLCGQYAVPYTNHETAEHFGWSFWNFSDRFCTKYMLTKHGISEPLVLRIAVICCFEQGKEEEIVTSATVLQQMQGTQGPSMVSLVSWYTPLNVHSDVEIVRQNTAVFGLLRSRSSSGLRIRMRGRIHANIARRRDQTASEGE
jgi:hypothetical protein